MGKASLGRAGHPSLQAFFMAVAENDGDCFGFHLARRGFVGNLPINYEPGRLNLKEGKVISVS